MCNEELKGSKSEHKKQLDASKEAYKLLKILRNKQELLEQKYEQELAAMNESVKSL